jgi:hypothetical protein
MVMWIIACACVLGGVQAAFAVDLLKDLLKEVAAIRNHMGCKNPYN